METLKGLTAKEVKELIKDNPYKVVEIVKNSERDLNGVIYLFSKVLQDLQYIKKFID